MKKKQDWIVAGKAVFVGLEDSKRTWKLCVRAEGMVVHETRALVKKVVSAFMIPLFRTGLRTSG